MAVSETGVYAEPTSYSRKHAEAEYEAQSGFGALSDLVRRLTADLGTMIGLKIDLLKAELKESISGYLKDSVWLAAAAVMGLFAFVFLNLTLMFGIAALLPFSTPVNLLLGALAITLLYAIGAGVILMMVKKHFANRTIVPERSVEEMKRDKQWLSETLT